MQIAEKINKNIDGILSPEEINKYLRNEPRIETTSRLIKNVSRDNIYTSSNKVDTVKNIFDYVVNHLKYTRSEINKNKGALRALQSGTGVCEEFANLFVALCRAKGIPARVKQGFQIPFRDENIEEINMGHSWAEVYFEQYGWVTFDPTNKISNSLRKDMEKAKITPYNALSELTQNRTYLTIDINMITAKYEGQGNFASKNLSISYSKL